MKWNAASAEQAMMLIAKGMHCRMTGEGLRISAISECLRAASHLCSAPGENRKEWEPAASLRLANMAKHRLVPLWPDLIGQGTDTRPGVLEVLNSLAALGDMARLTGGRWLPAPPHAIQVDDEHAVLLGGGPLEVLPSAITLTAKTLGRVRLVEQSACKDWTDIWEVKEWIGAPEKGLQTWAERLIAEAKEQLTDTPNDIGEAHAYVCTKWIRLPELPSGEKEFILCRTRSGQEAFSYFIGEFIRGNLKRLRSISSTDARRLRFYLDVKATRPYRVKATKSQGLTTLRLTRLLPDREAKVLLLGWQLPMPARERPGVTHHVFPWICPRITGHRSTLKLMKPPGVETLVESGISTHYAGETRCSAQWQSPDSGRPCGHPVSAYGRRSPASAS